MDISALFASLWGSRPTFTDHTGEIVPYTGDLELSSCLASVLIIAFIVYICVRKKRTTEQS